MIVILLKKYVLQISIGYKRKEDSSMEEMQTKEKQIVYDAPGGGSRYSEKRRL